MDAQTIIAMIDHTNLDPAATEKDVLTFAEAAQGSGVASFLLTKSPLAS